MPILHQWSRQCGRLGIGSLLLLASGCATQSAKPPAAKLATAPRHYAETIDIGGRFSAQFEHNGKPESWNGNFNWSQTPEATTVTLQSPLGQTLAEILIDHDSATLKQSGHPLRRAADVDALAFETLGWPLPVSGLRSWLQAYAKGTDGKPVTASPDVTTAISTWDGWSVRYVSWQDGNEVGSASDNTPVPKRIDMEHYTKEAGNVQMRLVISAWQPHFAERAKKESKQENE